MANCSSATTRAGRTGRLAEARVALAVLLAVLAVAGGCRKADETPAGPVGPEAMSEAEQARGREACTAYAERVCRCAKGDPSLAEACELGVVRPNALDGALKVVNDGHGKMAINDQIASQTTARRIIDRCFEADAKLDPATCPRKAPAPESAAAPASGTEVTSGTSDGPAGAEDQPTAGHE